jgi:hypothetical protein
VPALVAALTEYGVEMIGPPPAPRERYPTQRLPGTRDPMSHARFSHELAATQEAGASASEQIANTVGRNEVINKYLLDESEGSVRMR